MSAIILLAMAILGTVGLAREGTPVPALFFSSVALPFVAGGVWIRFRSSLAGVIGGGMGALMLWVVLAVLWGGFAFGEPPQGHLAATLLLYVAVALGTIGCLEACMGLRVPVAPAAALLGLAFGLLAVAPFFLISWLAGTFENFSEQAMAGWIVHLHPFSAACDAVGGLDGWRSDVLYRSAEIGPGYAIRYPSATAYSMVCLLVFAIGVTVRILGRMRTQRSDEGTCEAPPSR